jgi:propanol-preferring alcohol dehydrogenase
LTWINVVGGGVPFPEQMTPSTTGIVMLQPRPGAGLVAVARPTPAPGPGQLRIRVEACGVCRTDLHVADGDLPQTIYPVVPGHEVVGIVEECARDVDEPGLGQRVGVPWLAWACGHCADCLAGRENLCDAAQFTGCTRDGGFATHLLADAAFCIRLPLDADPVHLAPMLCAGLIGWRALQAAGDCPRLGLYGFGAAAHLVAQIARERGARVFAFTRPGDVTTQAFARSLGACWAGDSDASPPEPLDGALLFAPVGALVPTALRAVRKGGRVVCAGIHMSDIPSFPYRLLWGERHLSSVANLTRADARGFFAAAASTHIRTHVNRYPLHAANEALSDLRAGRFSGAAVLVP